MRNFLMSTITALAAVGFISLPEASAYTCSPNMKAYEVRSLDGRTGSGVRCVLFVEGKRDVKNRPVFAWYGEGNWGDSYYRHVGHAFTRRIGTGLRGFSADIFGNGETTWGNFPGNLRIRTSDEEVPRNIFVKGAWNEAWRLVPDGNVPYASHLGRVTECGPNLDSFKVYDYSNLNREGTGVRCVLKSGKLSFIANGNLTWFGDGFWNGINYAHLGSTGKEGTGATDMCDGRRWEPCRSYPFGSLRFYRVGEDLVFTGGWNEIWSKR